MTTEFTELGIVHKLLATETFEEVLKKRIVGDILPKDKIKL